ncbi:TetR family transcriptional regulator [Streptomyces sp. NBC_01725]|uniref:TetR family transcriptional regulator n=1 Tax=unclassified Streptomyces TaxID=2593676 RepID=UPI0011CC75B4|nr:MULTISPECIES: TetR family transcriptional regulator [unclassified Streptomyces]TXL89372.1 TetR/AcrR family transcriptional regulator [Streptomyces sp. IB2014 016-6]
MKTGQITSAGQASRRRLLDAATAEFAAYGIAGARVDRISAAAQVNKAQLYAYFGNKDKLFDAVFAEHLDLIVGTVPVTGDDLPGYAVRLYDAYLVHPELVRLATWARLERTPTGDLFHFMPGHDTEKLRSITDAQAQGVVDPSIPATEVLAMVTAMSMTWSPASVMYAASDDEPESAHDRRRAALALTVRRAFTP